MEEKKDTHNAYMRLLLVNISTFCKTYLPQATC